MLRFLNNFTKKKRKLFIIDFKLLIIFQQFLLHSCHYIHQIIALNSKFAMSLYEILPKFDLFRKYRFTHIVVSIHFGTRNTSCTKYN